MQANNWTILPASPPFPHLYSLIHSVWTSLRIPRLISQENSPKFKTFECQENLQDIKFQTGGYFGLDPLAICSKHPKERFRTYLFDLLSLLRCSTGYKWGIDKISNPNYFLPQENPHFSTSIHNDSALCIKAPLPMVKGS